MNKPNLSTLVPLISNALVSLKTSTDWDQVHTAANVALDFKKNPNTSHSEAWVASVIDDKQFITAGSDSIKTFVAITLQGRGDQDQWVTEYSVSYTLDGKTWIKYNEGENELIKGCSDRSSKVTHYFDKPFKARSISIHPTKWYGTIALRMEVYVEDFQAEPTPLSPPCCIQTGKVVIQNSSLSSSNNNGSHIVQVQFDKHFNQTPNIIIGFSTLSGSSSYNTNMYGIKVEAKNITNGSFDCEFSKPINGSRVFNLVAEYIAVSQ